MENSYQISKRVWNQFDFDEMGWHDNVIWAISFEEDIKFDIDYIFKWVEPNEKDNFYKFWISPATLIFHKPAKVIFEIELEFSNRIEIYNISKVNEEGITKYIIETNEGGIEIQTDEYTQIIRKDPILQEYQALTIEDRGPISFLDKIELINNKI